MIALTVEPILEIEAVCGGVAETYTFSEFPVRIGRDPSCELHLPYAFVSRRHARIERGEGGGFVLIDEGGRNGVAVGRVRLEREAQVELVDGIAFVIAMWVATVRVRDGNYEPPLLSSATVQVEPDFLARTAAVMEEYRAARAVALAIVTNSLWAVPAQHRARMVRQLVSLHKDMAVDPGFRHLIGRFFRDERSDGPPETAALRGLQRLAVAYVPDVMPPRDAQGIDALVDALDLALRTFLTAKAELDLVYLGEPDESQSSRGPSRGRQLGAELLDWRVDTAPVALRVERDFLHVVAQHVGLVTEVEAGVRALLDELSPTAIELSAKASRWQGPFWSSSLWRELARRHAGVTSTLDERLGRRFTTFRTRLLGNGRATVPSKRT